MKVLNEGPLRDRQVLSEKLHHEGSADIRAVARIVFTEALQLIEARPDISLTIRIQQPQEVAKYNQPEDWSKYGGLFPFDWEEQGIFDTPHQPVTPEAA